MTWDEMVEIGGKAAREAWLQDGADPFEQFEAGLRALRAAGVVMVPVAETTAIGAVMCGIKGIPSWEAALSAGEIKPEGE